MKKLYVIFALAAVIIACDTQSMFYRGARGLSQAGRPLL